MTAYAAEQEYPVPAASVTMTKGDRNDDVKWLQNALNTVTGSSLTVDGDFGGKTEEALKDFQQSAGLEATGVADEATVKALADAMNPEDEENHPGYEMPSEDTIRGRGLFWGYWSEYFRNLSGFIHDFPTKAKLLVEGIVGILILALEMILCFGFMLAIFSAFTASGFTMTNFDGDTVRVITGGPLDMSGPFMGVKILALLFILLSPFLCDLLYLNYFFELKGWKLVGYGFLYLIIRAVIGLIIFFFVYYLILFLMHFIAAFIAYIFNLIVNGFDYLISRGRDGYFKTPKEVWDEVFDDLLGIACRKIAQILSAILFVVLNINPILMVLTEVERG